MKIIYFCFISILSGLSVQAQIPELFKDDFSDNKNAWEQKANYVTSKIDSGKLVVTGDAAEHLKKVNVPIDTSKPYSLSVVTSAKLNGIDPRLLSDDLATGSGFIFCGSHFAYYEFLVYTDGSWVLNEIVNGKIKNIASEKNEAIRKGFGSLNTLKLISLSGQWGFLINDKTVYALKAKKYYGNNFGFSKEQNNCTASYDDFLISGTSPKITNGKLCTVLDQIFRNGSNAFIHMQGKFIKGAGQFEDKVYSSIIWPEGDSLATITYRTSNAEFNSTLKKFTTYDLAKKYLISLEATLEKCMPEYSFIYYGKTEFLDYLEILNTSIPGYPFTAKLEINRNYTADGTVKGYKVQLNIVSRSLY